MVRLVRAEKMVTITTLMNNNIIITISRFALLKTRDREMYEWLLQYIDHNQVTSLHIIGKKYTPRELFPMGSGHKNRPLSEKFEKKPLTKSWRLMSRIHKKNLPRKK